MFWDNVKSELKVNSLTLKDLSLKTELNYRTLQNQISRNIVPDAIQSVIIAKALNTTVEYLVTGEDSNPYKDKYEKLAQTIQDLANTL